MKLMRRGIFFIFAIFACYDFFQPVFAQNAKSSAVSTGTTAKGALTAATNKKNLDEAVSYLKKTSDSMTVAAEKRATLTILAGIEEQLGNYSDAQKHYAAAAGISGTAKMPAGIPNRSSAQLVIDAIRCALSAGDYSTADSYLNSSVRNSKEDDVVAHVKLYEQWSALCKANSSGETGEALAILKTYSTLDSMKSVRSSVLLTLWHLTGSDEYSSRLKKEFPKSMEAAVVKGEIQVLPSPFWYFVPRSGSDIPDLDIGKTETVAKSESQNQKSDSKDSDSSKNDANSNEKVVKQQLGLFRDKANAQSLFDKVKEKGFSPEIETEIRPSGTTYYLVVVRENKENTIGKQLKTAGFECYPLFQE